MPYSRSESILCFELFAHHVFDANIIWLIIITELQLSNVKGTSGKVAGLTVSLIVCGC